LNDRLTLRQTGEQIYQELFGSALPSARPDLAELQMDFSYGRIWSRPGLSRRERMIVTLTVLCVRQNFSTLERYIPAALNLGLSPESIDEIFIQCGIYVGLSTVSEDCLALAARLYQDEGLAVPVGPSRQSDVAEMGRLGGAVADRLHAERRYEGHAPADSPLSADFYRNIIEFAYGEIWQRPGLDIRERAMCALAAFTALAYLGLAVKFAKAAPNVGLSDAEVIEVIVQTAPYAGFAPVLQLLGAAGIRT
jgi:4-carboxymuconolactone decarboxylase